MRMISGLTWTPLWTPSARKDEVMMTMRCRGDWRWDDWSHKVRSGWMGLMRYLPLAFGPFPGTPPPLPGFLQGLQVWRLVHLRPGFLNVSCSVSHGCPLTLPKATWLKVSDHFQKSSSPQQRRSVIQGNKPPGDSPVFQGQMVSWGLVCEEDSAGILSPLTHQLSSASPPLLPGKLHLTPA